MTGGIANMEGRVAGGIGQDATPTRPAIVIEKFAALLLWGKGGPGTAACLERGIIPITLTNHCGKSAFPVRSSRQLHPATPKQGVPANPVSRTEQAGLAHEGLRGEPTANLDQGGYSRPSRRRHARGDGPADMLEVGGVTIDLREGTCALGVFQRGSGVSIG